MGKVLRRALGFLTLLTVLLTAACDKFKNSTPAQPGPEMRGGPGRPSSPVGDVMRKLAKGPQSLNDTIGRELKTEPPPWDSIQPRSKEFARLASSLSSFDPPKGSKESWQKKTASFSESAAALDHAVAAKDKAAALTAHAAIAQSCKGCHSEHRAGPGGKMGPGGPPRPPQP